MMRGVRSLLILLVIAVALGWYAWRDSQRPAGDDGPSRDQVFAVKAESIDEIAIRSEAGEQTRLQKSGEQGWQIVAPTTAPPDPAEVSGLTLNLARLEIQRVVDENPPDLNEYGLAQPRVEVAFKADGEEHRLLLGSKTPPGTDVYAKRGADNAVFLISSYLESTFNRSTFELRDKTVLKVERDKLDAVELTTSGRTVRFARADGEWRMTAPVPARADFSAVEGLVSRLSGLQMRSVIEDPAAARKAGLEKPVATARLGSGSSQATLAFGAPAEDGAVHARDLSRPVVFTVDASILDDLKKTPADLRQKDLFDARSFNATYLEITQAGQTSTFEKARVKNAEGQEEDRWKQTAPQERELEQASVDRLLSAVTGVRASGFVDAAPKALAAPSLSVVVRFDEGKKEERVGFARTGTEAFAARAGEPGAAGIEPDALEAITKALQELK